MLAALLAGQPGCCETAGAQGLVVGEKVGVGTEAHIIQEGRREAKSQVSAALVFLFFVFL